MKRSAEQAAVERIKGAKIVWHDGRMVLELEALIRLPVCLEVVQSSIEEKLKTVHLTLREQQVLKGVAALKRNKEIAAELHISERTVKFFVGALFKKFGVSGRQELAVMVAKWQ
jgi:DNA-binding CsgD family transcriptional regulator